ncbi:MAG: 3-oxoacid CoA-transferase subunit B [Hyphomicrobiales bacterium]|nr:MAG: 3-oxoacid CoA-transferase subunit B [Hyphomicrobiales bacterium]
MKTLGRSELARMVALHLPRQGFVNLGIGAPTEIGDYLPPDTDVMLHSENGVLNVGPRPPKEAEDWDLINAGKIPITLGTGGAFFDSTLSFAMMRGGHLDIAVLGAFQVSERGDIANWTTGESNGAPPGIGGAIDLAVGARTIWVMMDHTTKEGAPRIVRTCTFPLTAAKVVSRIFTNIAIVDVTPKGLVLDAVLDGLTPADVQAVTGAELQPAKKLRKIQPSGTVVS